MPVTLNKELQQPRFPGDFTIQFDPPESADVEQQKSADVLNGAVTQLAENADADKAANFPEKMLASRQDSRSAAAAELRAVAEKFVAGTHGGDVMADITKTLDRYRTSMPTFGARIPTDPSFAGAVDIVYEQPNYKPTESEQDFLSAINVALDEMQADEAKELDNQFSQNVKSMRQKQRVEFARRLVGKIDGFAAGDRSDGAAKAAVTDLLLSRGRYQALRDRLTRRLFNVSFTDGAAPTPDVKGGAGVGETPAILSINLLGGLPAPEDKASPEKLELYAQIHKTNTVIRAVCERLRERVDRKTGWTRLFEGTATDADDRIRKLHHEFLKKLHTVAVIGLELDFVDVAKSTLAELRAEFFALEAGRLKSAHSNGLAAVAFIGSFILLLAYGIISLDGCYDPGKCTNSWFFEHKNFLLAACGAAIGAWASFANRQITFQFEDLMMLEERAILPAMRILFVVVLALAACLLFWNSALTIEIGDLSTKAETFRGSGTVAVLIGLFCGLSERALATAIVGRAEAFVGGVAGGR
jgi:hypothetical protein